MSEKIETPRIFESNSPLQFFWCKRNEMFALNSLEVLDYKLFIYRHLKSSEFRFIVFLESIGSTYKYITYDRESYCIFNHSDQYDSVNHRDNINDFINRVEKKLAGNEKLENNIFQSGLFHVSKTNLPPGKGMKVEGNISIQNQELAGKLENFFTIIKPGLLDLKFAFVLPASVFHNNSHENFTKLLISLLTHPISCQNTILITIDNNDEYRDFRKAVKRDIPYEEKNIFELARNQHAKSLGNLIHLDQAENDEIRNILLRFRLLDPQNFNYTLYEAEQLIPKVKEYAREIVGKNPYLSLISALYDKQNYVSLIEVINQIRESLKDKAPDKIKKEFAVRKEKAALKIDRLPVKEMPKIDLTPAKDLFDKAKKELWEMTGLNTVKQHLEDALLKQLLDNEKIPGHYIFQGNPGTGKTVVARLMGQMFKAIGLLEKGHTVEAGRENLVGPYQGFTEQYTLTKLEEAKGGVLLIDEAYALTKNQQGTNDIGQHAITTILKYMEDNKKYICIIFTGYRDDMKDFMSSNEGFDRRITKIIDFPNYSPDELVEILISMTNKQGYILDNTYINKAKEVFSYQCVNNPKGFGNAGFVSDKLLTQSKALYARRFASELLGGTFDKSKHPMIADDVPADLLPFTKKNTEEEKNEQ